MVILSDARSPGLWFVYSIIYTTACEADPGRARSPIPDLSCIRSGVAHIMLVTFGEKFRAYKRSQLFEYNPYKSATSRGMAKAVPRQSSSRILVK